MDEERLSRRDGREEMVEIDTYKPTLYNPSPTPLSRLGEGGRGVRGVS
jgi:hypothetical protein